MQYISVRVCMHTGKEVYLGFTATMGAVAIGSMRAAQVGAALNEGSVGRRERSLRKSRRIMAGRIQMPSLLQQLRSADVLPHVMWIKRSDLSGITLPEVFKTQTKTRN